MQSERLRARPCSQRAGGEAPEPEVAGRAVSPGRGQEAPRGSHGDTGAGPHEGALGQPCTQAHSTPGGAGILGSLLGGPSRSSQGSPVPRTTTSSEHFSALTASQHPALGRLREVSEAEDRRAVWDHKATFSNELQVCIR